jgi:GDP-4-dehydro-6-deoxy-D-mannose reductase
MANSPSGPEPAPFDRILVTGSSGFVGRYLLPSLAERLRPGAKIFLADRHIATSTPMTDLDLEVVPLDITDADRVRRVIESIQPDLVVHLAGQAATGLGPDQNQSTWAVNFGGAFALAAAIADYAPECTFLSASSAEVYGLAFNKGPVTEDTPLEPTSTYAHSKAAAEWMLADILPASSRLILMRPSNHIGAGQTLNFVVPAFADQIARLERVGGGEMRVGNLDAERDFMNVRDVVRAYVDIIVKSDTLSSRNVFNVGSGNTIKVSVLLDALMNLSPVRFDVIVDPERWRAAEVPITLVDAQKLRDATGWRPRHSVDDAVREVLEEFRQGVDR